MRSRIASAGPSPDDTSLRFMCPLHHSHAGRMADRAGANLSSASLAGQRIAATLGVELGDRVVDGAVEVIRASKGLVGQVVTLQIAPQGLDVVQLRGVFRQPLDGEPVRALGQGGAGRLAGVDRPVVEHEDDGSRHLARPRTPAPVELLQEGDDVRAALGPAGPDDETASRPVEHAEHRHLRSEEHTSELQSRQYLVCRLLLEKKKKYTAEQQTSQYQG